MLKFRFFDKLHRNLAMEISNYMNNKNNLIIPFLILGFSIIIGVFIFVGAWNSNQSVNQTITVTGSAKKEIISDLGFLRGTLTVQLPHLKMSFVS